jgi:hypothetical protein
MKQFPPPAEPHKTDVASVVDLHPLPEILYDDYNADDESDDSFDSGGAEGKPPVSLRQTAFSLMQFPKRMAQANYSAFNNWKK